ASEKYSGFAGRVQRSGFRVQGSGFNVLVLVLVLVRVRVRVRVQGSRSCSGFGSVRFGFGFGFGFSFFLLSIPALSGPSHRGRAARLVLLPSPVIIKRIEDFLAWQNARALERRVFAFTAKPPANRDFKFCD